jgi:hypothetical protein
MPHDEDKADQLAPSYLNGTYHSATVGATAMRGVRRARALRQAVAIGRRAWQAADGIEGDFVQWLVGLGRCPFAPENTPLAPSRSYSPAGHELDGQVCASCPVGSL